MQVLLQKRENGIERWEDKKDTAKRNVLRKIFKLVYRHHLARLY